MSFSKLKLAAVTATAIMCGSLASAATYVLDFGNMYNVDNNYTTTFYTGTLAWGDITDVDLTLTSISGSFLYDLDITLSHNFQSVDIAATNTAPTAGEYLFPGESYTFDDDLGSSLNPLSAFNGSNIFGIWSLSFFDDYFPYEGDDFAGTLTITTSEIPLPASLPLLLAGFGGLAVMRRKTRT